MIDVSDLCDLGVHSPVYCDVRESPAWGRGTHEAVVRLVLADDDIYHGQECLYCRPVPYSPNFLQIS
jgi:hypothetical protein